VCSFGNETKINFDHLQSATDGCKELEESSARERGMEGLDKGGQGLISGCVIEEEDLQSVFTDDSPEFYIVLSGILQ
jgi:hypothetical protein